MPQNWLANQTQDAARERIIDAAERTFAESGMSGTPVQAIASAARCSRATFYRYFDSRDELVAAVMMRQANRLVLQIQERLATIDDPGEAIVQAIVLTVNQVPRHPQLAMFFEATDLATTHRLVGEPGMIFDLAGLILGPLLETARERGNLRPGITIPDATEWTVRSALSLLSLPGPVKRTDQQLAQMIRTYLLPALVHND